MRTVRIKTSRIEECVAVCRRNVFEKELAPRREMLLSCGGLIFTDETVYSLYGDKIQKYLNGVPVHVMPAGEENKSEQTLFSLLSAMAAADLRRGSVLVALGGGVVGDVGGLAASLYMRGIDCIQVPTTLLAQADSSIGGKTAIDFLGVKNLIGSFKAPALIFADPSFLDTLPFREFRSGLGEIIKHGALCPPIFEKLWENRENLFDLKFLGGIVPENIAFKASVVRQDAHERDLRKSLNLGHTTAHALELSGIGLSHGECVLWGILLEERIAARRMHVEADFLARLEFLCRKALENIPPLKLSEETARLALYDKKNNSQSKVVLTVCSRLGAFELLELPYAEYERALKETWRELC